MLSVFGNLLSFWNTYCWPSLAFFRITGLLHTFFSVVCLWVAISNAGCRGALLWDLLISDCLHWPRSTHRHVVVQRGVMCRHKGWWGTTCMTLWLARARKRPPSMRHSRISHAADDASYPDSHPYSCATAGSLMQRMTQAILTFILIAATQPDLSCSLAQPSQNSANHFVGAPQLTEQSYVGVFLFIFT